MDKLDKKADVIMTCGAVFGELQDCKTYTPRKFFKRATKSILKEFNKELKRIDKTAKIPNKTEVKPIPKEVVKIVSVVENDLADN